MEKTDRFYAADIIVGCPAINDKIDVYYPNLCSKCEFWGSFNTRYENIKEYLQFCKNIIIRPCPKTAVGQLWQDREGERRKIYRSITVEQRIEQDRRCAIYL